MVKTIVEGVASEFLHSLDLVDVGKGCTFLEEGSMVLGFEFDGMVEVFIMGVHVLAIEGLRDLSQSILILSSFPLNYVPLVVLDKLVVLHGTLESILCFLHTLERR